jgi:hypothetical protein
MTEKPILFSGPMVRAILDERKTQTRRVLKPQPEQNGAGLWVFPPNWTAAAFKKWTQAVQTEESGLRQMFQSEKVKAGLPYAVGDLLWVRERLDEGDAGSVVYHADGDVHPDAEWVWQRKSLPSIHCPRGLSRITLKVTAVRVERLQDISEDDAKAEGCSHTWSGDMNEGPSAFPDENFQKLWTSINGAESWAANPWVAAYSFEPVK